MSSRNRNAESELVVGEETTLEQLLWFYSDLFQEQFPTERCEATENSKLKEIISDCIVSQQAYEIRDYPNPTH